MQRRLKLRQPQMKKWHLLQNQQQKLKRLKFRQRQNLQRQKKQKLRLRQKKQKFRLRQKKQRHRFIQLVISTLTSRVPMQLLQNRWQRTWRLMNLILQSRACVKHWGISKWLAAKPAQNPMNLTSAQQTCMKQMDRLKRRS